MNLPKILLTLLLLIGLQVVTTANAVIQPGVALQKSVKPMTTLGEFHPSRVLVKFKDNSKALSSLSVDKQYVLKRQASFRYVGVGVYHLPDKTLSIHQVIRELKKNPLVEYAELDYRYQIAAQPDDVLFLAQWGLHNTAQSGGLDDADIDAPEAWGLAIDTSNIVVAIVDTGIDYTHPELQDNMWENPGEIAGNGIDDDGNGYIDDIHGIDTVNDDSDPMDDHNHGTHVAGIVGAVGNNTIGISGVSGNVQLMALKFLNEFGGGFASDAIELLNYITSMRMSGVNVLVANHSWGGGGFSQAMLDAFNLSAALGVSHTIAIGNSSLNNDTSPTYPASYEVPGLVNVAATTPADGLSSFSNFGASTVDIAAPGSEILSTVMGGDYASYSGTSMAAPFVAGSLVQVLAQDPALTPSQARSRLMGTADSLPLVDPHVLSGRLNLHYALTCVPGNPQFNVNLQSGFVLEVGMLQTVSAYLSDCGVVNADAMDVSISNSFGLSETVVLLDDGQGTDAVAGDGFFSAQWFPTAVTSYSLDFSYLYLNGSGNQQVLGNVVPLQAYLFNDSEPFQWQDIGATGSSFNMSCDECSDSISLPFPISFYGQGYSNLNVSSNGVMSFDGVVFSWSNNPIPSAAVPNTIIAPFWSDFDLSANGKVVWQAVGVAPHRQFIVQFDNVPFFFASDNQNGFSFQVIFNESSSDVLFQYLDVQGASDWGDFGQRATIGLQRDGSYGQQYSFNQAVLQDQMAIKGYQLTSGVRPSQSLIDVGGVSLGNVVQHELALTNFSAESYNIANVVQTGLDSAEFAIVNDECSGIELMLGEQCVVIVGFAPLSVGEKTTALTFTPVEATQSSVNAVYRGEGVIAPNIVVQDSVSFNYVEVTQRAEQELLIENHGNDILNMSSILISSDTLNAFDLTGDCSVIAVGEECRVWIGYQSSTLAPATASLIISSNDPDTPMVTVELQGHSVMPVSVGYAVADIYGGMAPLSINFSSAAVGGSGDYLYQWDFSDEPISQEQNPVHLFSAGNFEVVVTVADVNNPANMASSTLQITAISPLVIQQLSADKLAGVASLPVQFDIGLAGGSGAYGYHWDFGDGNSSNDAFPSHIFQEVGRHTVTVTVADLSDTNNIAVGSLHILVVAAPDPIGVALSSTRQGNDIPAEITISAMISGGNAPYTIAWNFGDGNSKLQEELTVNQASVTHTYTDAGSYVITAVVTSNNGAGSSFSSTAILDTKVEVAAMETGGGGALGPVALLGLLLGGFYFRFRNIHD